MTGRGTRGGGPAAFFEFVRGIPRSCRHGGGDDGPHAARRRLQVDGLDGDAVLDIAMPVVQGLMAAGGDRDNEQTRLEYFAERCARDLEKVWAPIHQIAVRSFELYTDPAALEVARRTEFRGTSPPTRGVGAVTGVTCWAKHTHTRSVFPGGPFDAGARMSEAGLALK